MTREAYHRDTLQKIDFNFDLGPVYMEVGDPR